MPEPPHDYRIDYDAPDVLDLMRQVRERVASQTPESPSVPAMKEDARARLREWVQLDEGRPAELERSLGLGGAWNVTPEDLHRSHPGPFGALVGGIRRALRPVTKLLANLELPLYKQYKLNLGLAAAVHELLVENQRLRGRLAALQQRVTELEEGGAAGPGTGTDPEGDTDP